MRYIVVALLLLGLGIVYPMMKKQEYLNPTLMRSMADYSLGQASKVKGEGTLPNLLRKTTLSSIVESNKDKLSVFVVIASTCSVCKRWLAELASDRDKKELFERVVYYPLIQKEDWRYMSPIFEENKIPVFPFLVMDDFLRRYNITAVPYTIIVNSEMDILWVREGYVSPKLIAKIAKEAREKRMG